MNPWLAHVKKYFDSHNVSYAQALKEAKKTYKPKKKAGRK